MHPSTVQPSLPDTITVQVAEFTPDELEVLELALDGMVLGSTLSAEQVVEARRALAFERLARLRQLARGDITVEECHADLARMMAAGKKLGSVPDEAWQPPSFRPLPARKTRSAK